MRGNNTTTYIRNDFGFIFPSVFDVKLYFHLRGCGFGLDRENGDGGGGHDHARVRARLLVLALGSIVDSHWSE